MTHRGHEVGLHLRHLFETAGHLGLGLVSADLAEHQARGSGQRAEVLDLILGEVTPSGLPDDDHTDTHRLHLERGDDRLSQAQVLQHQVGVRVLVDPPDMDRPNRPIGLGDDVDTRDVHHRLLGVHGPAVHPDRAHHLELVEPAVVEEHHADLGVEVATDGSDQVGDDLGQRLGAGQGGRHLVEALEVESLVLEGSLSRGGHDHLALELEAGQGCGRGHDQDREHGAITWGNASTSPRVSAR